MDFTKLLREKLLEFLVETSLRPICTKFLIVDYLFFITLGSKWCCPENGLCCKCLRYIKKTGEGKNGSTFSIKYS